MRRFLTGFVVGGAITGVAVAGLAQAGFGVGELAHARRMGQLDGVQRAMQAIDEEFGRVESDAEFTPLFSLKTSVAVSLEVDGVKTIRVVP